LKGLLAFLVALLAIAFAFSATKGYAEINSAKAYALTQEANIKAQQYQFEQQLAAEREYERQQLWNDTYIVRVGVVSLFFVVLLIGVSYAVLGTATSYVTYTREASRLKGSLIYPKNGALPVMFDNPDNPRFLVNPETGLVLKLNRARGPDRMLVESKTAVQLAKTEQPKLEIIK